MLVRNHLRILGNKMYITPIVNDIREMERIEATSRVYSPGELEKEIRKYTLRTYACIGAVLLSMATIGGIAFYHITHNKDNEQPTGLVAVALGGAVAMGIILGVGKVSAIKADAFDLAKKQRDASRKVPTQ